MADYRELANAVRALSMDGVQKAKSGHPGAPMGMADIAEVLWRHFLNHNPADPKWVNRDRFVLSNGHGSMLLYSLLHLTGYNLSIEDLKNLGLNMEFDIAFIDSYLIINKIIFIIKNIEFIYSINYYITNI